MVLPLQGQAEELRLSLSKSFGYNDFGGNIQGTFTLSVNEIAGLERVLFLIDGKTMGWVTQPPYQLSFDTKDFAHGIHTLSAIGYTSDGTALRTNEIRTRFLSAEEGRQKTMSILLPLFGAVFGVMFLSLAIPVIMGGRNCVQEQSYKPGDYGLLGGAVCPKCGGPFGMHLWGLNLLRGKFERCPHCGKWSMVRRSSRQELGAAEEALMKKGDVPVMNGLSEMDRIKRELDESRFMDG